MGGEGGSRGLEGTGWERKEGRGEEGRGGKRKRFAGPM